MPGIVGIVEGDNELFDRMISSVMHEQYHVDRHTDDFFRCARVHLGTFNPGQPASSDGVYVLIDGKVYGIDKSDPQYCLEQYLKSGTDFIRSLNGSFVLVIYDTRTRKVIIANDRYGLRPLYYAVNGGRLLFAPEVKAILEDSTLKKEISDEGVTDFIVLGKLMGNRTMFRGIEALPPATIMTWNAGSVTLETYWKYQYQDKCDLTEDELADRLVTAFRKAVEIRTRDNLRYAVSLSGGLDSRAIVGAVPADRRSGFRAISFGTPQNRESGIAREVARVSGIPYEFMELTPELIRKNAEKTVFLSDGMDIFIQGYADYIFEGVRKETDVVFNGLALDATLGGTYTYNDLLGMADGEAAYESFRKRQFYVSPEKMKELFKPEFYGRIKDVPERTLREWYDDGSETVPANKVTRFLFRNRMERLVFMRSVLQRYKVEDALPTVDYDLIDVILSVPAELRCDHRLYRKFLMKLSPELARVPYQKTLVRASAPLWAWKLGKTALRARNAFRRHLKLPGADAQEYIDMDRLLSVEMKDFVRDMLLSDRTLSTKKYLNSGYLEKIIGENERGIRHTRELIYLISFELFLRQFSRYLDDKHGI